MILSKGDIRPIIESLESYEVGQVLDEISIYLKQKMLLNDPKFDIYMFDRFFRIIGNSKELLSMNSDGGFVLILALSKFVEAVSVDTIENIVQKLQPTTKQTIDEKIDKTITQKEETVVKSTESLGELKYKELIKSIYNRSYDLGVCFEKSFQYASFEDKILKINSTATGECKAMLYKNFTNIKLFVEEVFGEDTKLDFAKIQKEPTKEMVRVIQPSIKIAKEDQQPSSCVSSMSDMKNPNLAQIELNMDDMLNSKMVNTALKLLQSPNPPRVKSKL